jgi:tetrapyrrole methylase family protein/MazG family protein
MTITVVGLGPGDGGLLTRQAWQVLSAAGTVYLRTARHPAVADLPESVQQVSFDHLYEAAEDFSAVYSQIVAELLRLEQAEGAIVYAVPGHPLVGESTVTALLAEAETAGVQVEIVAGLSFVEPALTAVGVDGLDGLQLFDAIEIAGYHHPPVNPELPLLLAQVYSQFVANELKLSLMSLYPDEHGVVLIHGAGTAEQVVEPTPLYGIDRTERVGHLTSLYVPPLPHAASLATLAETVAILRAPGGCPWDQEQTAQSMRAGFLEEAAEVLAAIDADDPAALAEELGDVLYHLVMQAQMAAENGDFSLVEVVAGIDEKLKRRHPHVWGDWQVADSAEVVRNWEMIKAQEKGTQGNLPSQSRGQELGGTQEGDIPVAEKSTVSLLDNIPVALPALARAQKIQGRVKKVGFDWPDISGVLDKVREEVAELQAATTPAEQASEMGDVFFALVNVARWLEIDAETALREANLRFSRRWQRLEEIAAERGLVLGQLEVMALEELWQAVKQEGVA